MQLMVLEKGLHKARFKLPCSFLGPKYLNNNPKWQWVRFYYFAQPPELINFSKLAKEFPSETAHSLLVLLLLCKPLDVIHGQCGSHNHTGMFNFKLLKIKYHLNATSSVIATRLPNSHGTSTQITEQFPLSNSTDLEKSRSCSNTQLPLQEAHSVSHTRGEL